MQSQDGFSLVEVLVALVIMAVAVVGMQTMTAKYVHDVVQSDVQAEALQLVRDRLDQIRTDPEYEQLVATYSGTETDFPQLPGVTRQTQVVRNRERVGQKEVDFTRVTVTVRGPGLTVPIARSISVGAP